MRKSEIFTEISGAKIFKNERGMSGIIVTMIMIALVLAATVLVWGVVNNILGENIERSGSCFEVFDKVSIGKRYTCYDSGINATRFQVVRGDVGLDGILVTVSGNTDSRSFTLTREYQNITGLMNYSGGGNETKMPGRNSGITYVLNWSDVENPPNLIQVSPKIGNNQCDVSDTLSGIDDCSLLV